MAWKELKILITMDQLRTWSGPHRELRFLKTTVINTKEKNTTLGKLIIQTFIIHSRNQTNERMKALS